MPEAFSRECGICKKEVPGWQPIFGCPGCGLKSCEPCHEKVKKESGGKCPSCGKAPGDTVVIPAPKTG